MCQSIGMYIGHVEDQCYQCYQCSIYNQTRLSDKCNTAYSLTTLWSFVADIFHLFGKSSQRPNLLKRLAALTLLWAACSCPDSLLRLQDADLDLTWGKKKKRK